MAIAIGLRTAASGSIAGIEETSVRALAKLQQVLPSRLRHRVSAFQSHMLPMPSSGPQVDPDVLTVIASACRDHERLRFDYRTHSGAGSQRSVEPYRLINDRRRWYLVAWDVDRDAWRTFQVDRIEPRTPAGPRFTPRATTPITRSPRRWHVGRRGNLAVPGTGDRARGDLGAGRLPIQWSGSLGEDRCAFEPGSDHPEMLALYLGMLDADFEIVDAPELVDALRKLASRYQRAVDTSQRPAVARQARTRSGPPVEEAPIRRVLVQFCPEPSSTPTPMSAETAGSTVTLSSPPSASTSSRSIVSTPASSLGPGPSTTTRAPATVTWMLSACSVPDRHDVGYAVSAAGGRTVHVRTAEVGPRHVVDSDHVGAAERGQVQPFDTVHVHADVGDVTKEQRPLAVGRQTHDLVYAGSVEVESVGAVLALDDVAAVARIPAGCPVRSRAVRCRCRGSRRPHHGRCRR